MKARFKREKIETYQAGLLHLLVKRYYDGVKAPSEYADSVMMPKEAEPEADGSIIEGLIKKLGG